MPLTSNAIVDIIKNLANQKSITFEQAAKAYELHLIEKNNAVLDKILKKLS